MEPNQTTFEGRFALVTGASRGIGYAVAKALALAGAHVIALARTKAGLEELDDAVMRALSAQGREPHPLTLVPLDLREGDAIDRLGAALYERFGRLDILVGNAGILGALSPLEHLAPKVWEDTLALNLTAQWRLIRSLDPLLRFSLRPRVLFMTSGVTRSLPAYWGGYSVSKAGLEALVKTYAAEKKTTAMGINLLNPGPVRTRMRAQAMPGEDPETLPSPEDLAPFVLSLLREDMMETGQIYTFTPAS